MGLTRAHKSRRPLAIGDVEPAADLLRSLANPQRLMIVCTLVEGERAVSELERDLAIRQPSLSQHLANLREAGIISGRREAKAVFYRISDERASLLVEALHAIFCEPTRRAAPLQKIDVSGTRDTKKAPRSSEAAFFAHVGESEDV